MFGRFVCPKSLLSKLLAFIVNCLFFCNQGSNFIGRDALLKQRGELLSKKLVCLTLDTDNIDAEGNETIWFGGRVSLYFTF